MVKLRNPIKKIYIKNEEIPFYDEFGTLVDGSRGSFLFKKDDKLFSIKADDEIWKTLTVKDSAYIS